MTLIGRYQLNNVPVMVGDLMLSTETRPANAVSLPTHGTISDAISQDRFYSGLSQKVCIINDRLIIGWAGSWIAAKAVLQVFKDAFRERAVTREAVGSIFRDLEPEYLTQLALVGLCHNGGLISTFTHNTYDWTPQGGVPGVGQCSAAGSGDGELVYQLNLGSIKFDPTANILDRAKAYGLSVLSGMVGAEVSSRNNFERAFGGGYELALFEPNGPAKIDDTLHLFWFWEKGTTQKPVLYPLLIKSDYIGSDLILQRIYAEPNRSTRRYEIRDRRVYAVRTPLDPQKSFEELEYERPDLNPHWLCCYYGCSNKGKGKILTSQKYSAKKDSHIRIVERDGGGIKFEFNADYIEKEHKLLLDALSQVPEWNM